MQKLIAVSFKTMLRKLYVAEHFRFYDIAIIKALITLMTSLPQINGIFNILKSAFDREDAIYKLSQASILTKDIRFLHGKRTAFVSYLWASIAIARYSTDQAKIAAVDTMEFLHNIYKDMTRENYYAMSGMLINLLEDLEKPAYKPSVQLLGLAQIVTDIKTSQEEFDTLYEERSMDKGSTADLGKLAEARTEVDETFTNLVDTVNVTWMLNETGAKDPALRTNLLEVKRIIANAINEAELVLARRGHHKAKEDDKDNTGNGTTTPPTPPTPPPPGTQQPNTDRPDAPDTDQKPTDEPHHLDPDEHPFAGERKKKDEDK